MNSLIGGDTCSREQVGRGNKNDKLKKKLTRKHSLAFSKIGKSLTSKKIRYALSKRIIAQSSISYTYSNVI
ncbi:MAG: hypothetical protein Kow0081_3900 [Candidatus Dojkabacteria bacterium]